MPRTLKLKAFSLLIFLLIFSVVSSIPFLGQKISLRTANADVGISIDGLSAHNNIYYIRAGEASLKTIRVSTDGEQLYDLGTSQLPAGITVSNSSSSVYQITIQDVEIPDDLLPESYGISFNATSAGGPEARADIIFVIEPRGGQHPSVTFDKPSYSVGDRAYITVLDPHIDCNVHELNDGLNPFVTVTVNGPGFSREVPLERDEYSTNVFNGSLSLVVGSTSSGPFTATYERSVTSLSQCVWPLPAASESVQDEANLSVVRTYFDKTVYTRDDNTAVSGPSNAVTLTVFDGSNPLSVDVQIEAGPAAPPGSVHGANVTEDARLAAHRVLGGTLVPLVQDPQGSGTFKFTGTVEQLFDRAGLHVTDFHEWPINITASYRDTVAVAAVFANRGLSSVIPDGRAAYLTNDTATLELIDPASNANPHDFDAVTVTLCSYDHSNNNFVIGGRSDIPLFEVGRDTGKFVSGYQLAFIDGSYDVNQITDTSQRELFGQSHVRVNITQTTDVIAIVGMQDDNCPQVPSDFAGLIHTSFTVDPSVTSDPDSGGRGQNVGANPHKDPPLVTVAMINCANYGGDFDKDGLCNNWETGAGLKIWYPSGSANYYVFTYVNDPYPNPNHKDMLVEIDYVDNSAYCASPNNVSFKPSSTAITNLKNAFNTGNIPNPDLTKGIKLHIYYASNGGEKINSYCYNSVTAWYNGTGTQYINYDTIKNTYFGSSTGRVSSDRGKAQWQAFHYCLFIPKQYQDTSSSGVAEQLGNDCVVSLGIAGFFNSVAEQQGTLMHELGHNLGLYHGGPAVTGNDYNINCKPNYPSVMTYGRQVPTPYSNASLTYSEDSLISSDTGQTSPNISSIDPDEAGVLKLSPSSALSIIQIVWGVGRGATIPPPANIGKSYSNIDWSNGGGIVDTNAPLGYNWVPPSEINMLGISGCTSGDPIDPNHSLSGADDWQNIEDTGNMNFRENNPDSFATGIHSPGQPETATQYMPLEPNTNTSRQLRAQFINTTNALVQSIGNCSEPLFSSNQPSYVVGDEIMIDITDPDANVNTGSQDVIEGIRVFSDTDAVGMEFAADETATNTGIFTLDFDTSGSAQNDTITVSSGDDVTIRYTDNCSQDVSVPRDFSFSVGIDHVASTNVTKAPILGAGKKEFEDRLVLDSDSVRMLVLNQSGEASERVSVEKAIKELKDLRLSLDGFDGGNATDDSFKESQLAVNTLKFLTDSIGSLQFALDVPYQKEPFEITSSDLDCDGGDGCTIRGYSDTATSTVETFPIDPDKKRMTFHGTGQGDLILQGSSDLMPIRNLQSATTRQDFEFETINSTAVLFRDLPYNFKDLAIFYGPDLVSPSTPMLRALDGSPLHQAVNGSQSIIVVNLTNYELALNLTDFWQEYSSIIEIRNSDDVTVFLGWQPGILEPDSIGCIFCKNATELSWTPDELGNYTIRTFVVSDLEQPRILSGVKETSIMVVKD